MEPIKILKVTNHVGKSGKAYSKLNGEFFIWENDLKTKLESNVNKTLMMEINRIGQFPKVAKIGDICPEEPPQISEISQSESTSPVEIGKALVKEETLLLLRDKPNSRTFGKGHDQVKLYFSDAKDLEEQMRALNNLGLMPEGTMKDPLALIEEAREFDFETTQKTLS